ncbi:hypothetical protein J7I97_16700 [Streptomyces sp. ISL-87]|uniref:hypothetical protein n=1 Tax=Streptomyces sp. ISL-87 TaxID=2819188 RepID=UPI001BE7FAD7|nr:hypothetical protein [Streptomyces sp. ISL-87]MBT2609874.1 hypothetical protein [Streptomyces sp. ISL-87]
MRPRKLPSDHELLKLREANLTHGAIAKRFGVSRQAVTRLYNGQDIRTRQGLQEVTDVLPWSLDTHPAKKKLASQAAYLGLRAYLRVQLGQEISPRSEQARRAFLNRITSGREVLAVEEDGAHYVPRAADGGHGLIIQWPAEVPLTERDLELFSFDAAEAAHAAGERSDKIA